MTLTLITDDEVIINDDNRYIKMRVRRELEEIFLEIMNDKSLIKRFYETFDRNIKLFHELLSHIDDMTPGERMIRLSILPPIPEFLCGTDSIYLKIHNYQFIIINKISRILNTEMSNLSRIIFYMSLPTNLYMEFPYLLDHFQYAEELINFYLVKTDGKKRLEIYERLKNFI